MGMRGHSHGMVPVSHSNAIGAALEFAGEELVLLNNNALYWPRERALLVADLHLEKGSWYAQTGQMLPPYDSHETLGRITDAIRQTDAKRVITLGDNFHDDAGLHRLDTGVADTLCALIRSLDWVWITGNHDESMPCAFGASIHSEINVNGIILRHEAQAGETRPEISGHYHPKIRTRIKGRYIARSCAVIARSRNVADRMIAPAFGAYTGGMDANAPVILKVLSPANAVAADTIEAVLPVKGRLARFALNSL